MSQTLGDLIGAEHTFLVLVGNNRDVELPREFTLRCENFLARSQFFREAREDAWNTQPKCWSGGPIILANDSPETFAAYARFVYFGDI